jgi:hypothetical protein
MTLSFITAIIHFYDARYDRTARLAIVNIEWPAFCSVASRIQAKFGGKHLKSSVFQDQVSLQSQDHPNRSTFGKRTPKNVY